MKSGWEKYASEKRYVQKGYFRKYSDGGSGRKACEASRCDRIQQSRKEQEKVETDIQSYGRVVLLTEEVIYTGDQNESVREEDVGETHQEGRQGVPQSDQGRCETQETNTSETQGEEMKKSANTKKPASKTSTATKTATATKTSTDAYTQGNITVTGGAGKGATNVKIAIPGQGTAKKAVKAKGRK